MISKCAAYLCNNKIDNKYFMCARHWRMVPTVLQVQLWRNYKPGQETDGQVSVEYMRIATNIIQKVKEIEKQGMYPV